MDDDFNTGGAVGVLFELLTPLNRFADDEQAGSRRRPTPTVKAEFMRRRASCCKELASILGLFSATAGSRPLGGGDDLVAGLMQLLIDLRNNLRTEAKESPRRTTRSRSRCSTRPT